MLQRTDPIISSHASMLLLSTIRMVRMSTWPLGQNLIWLGASCDVQTVRLQLEEE